MWIEWFSQVHSWANGFISETNRVICNSQAKPHRVIINLSLICLQFEIPSSAYGIAQSDKNLSVFNPYNHHEVLKLLLCSAIPLLSDYNYSKMNWIPISNHRPLGSNKCYLCIKKIKYDDILFLFDIYGTDDAKYHPLRHLLPGSFVTGYFQDGYDLLHS